MAPTLRQFQPSDLGVLYELDQICFAPGVAYSRAQIAAYVRQPGSKTWIAENVEAPELTILGFVIAHCGRQRQGHIITLDVAPQWRRQAVGTLLMDAAESWMRRSGMEVVSLETAEENLTAQVFYGRRGYRKLRRIEHYYGPGAAAWRLAKALHGSVP